MGISEHVFNLKLEGRITVTHTRRSCTTVLYNKPWCIKYPYIEESCLSYTAYIWDILYVIVSLGSYPNSLLDEIILYFSILFGGYIFQELKQNFIALDMWCIAMKIKSLGVSPP